MTRFIGFPSLVVASRVTAWMDRGHDEPTNPLKGEARTMDSAPLKLASVPAITARGKSPLHLLANLHALRYRSDHSILILPKR